MANFETKIEAFRALLEKDQLAGLIERGVDCEGNRVGVKCSVKPGLKYTKVDIGYSGRYMVVNATEEIFGIKGYGVIHKGHKFGTLDTINDYYWGEYRGVKKATA